MVASGRRNNDAADHGTLHCLPKQMSINTYEAIIPSPQWFSFFNVNIGKGVHDEDVAVE